MMEITIINPIEQIELICQAMLDLQYFIKNDINDSIKTQFFQINKSLTIIHKELKKLGY